MPETILDRRKNAYLAAVFIKDTNGISEVVEAARKIDRYSSQSAIHAEAVRMATVRGEAHSVLDFITQAEAICDFLAEPSPSVPSDQQLPPSASQSAA
jgi:hypothetical protein